MIADISDRLGVTSVVISHDMASTFRIGDRVSMLYKGRIIVSGTPEEILHSPNPELREFISVSKAVDLPPLSGEHGVRVNNLGPAIKVGVTIIVIVVLGYWATMMLAKGSCAGKEENLVVHAYFADATNLVEKSRVQIAGLAMGHLVSRELNVEPPRRELILEKRFAKITVALDKQVTLYSNARVFKKSASLLGEYYLEIDPGTHEWVDKRGRRHVGEKLKSGDEIRLRRRGGDHRADHPSDRASCSSRSTTSSRPSTASPATSAPSPGPRGRCTASPRTSTTASPRTAIRSSRP